MSRQQAYRNEELSHCWCHQTETQCGQTPFRQRMTQCYIPCRHHAWQRVPYNQPHSFRLQISMHHLLFCRKMRYGNMGPFVPCYRNQSMGIRPNQSASRRPLPICHHRLRSYNTFSRIQSHETFEWVSWEQPKQHHRQQASILSSFLIDDHLSPFPSDLRRWNTRKTSPSRATRMFGCHRCCSRQKTSQHSIGMAWKLS